MYLKAIHRLDKPANVTANFVGDNIYVEWNKPTYHPENVNYMLRVSHFPFTSHLDIKIDGNMTSYIFEVTSHRGQNFSVQLQSVSNDLKSHFTDPVFTHTSKSFFCCVLNVNTVTENHLPLISVGSNPARDFGFFHARKLSS